MIELATVFAGPGIGIVLGDQGADVIKVEPITGDPIRGYATQGTDSHGFVAWNRNKRGIAVDLRVPAGKEIIEKLILSADVVTENFRPGVLERQGISYESLRERNPRLIWVSVTGYGPTGPYRDKRGYDLVAQAEGGTLSYRQWPDGTPMQSGMTLGDNATGMYGTQGVLLALYQRALTGVGQHVQVTLLNSVMSLHGPRFLVPDPKPATPLVVPKMVPWQAPYRCADGEYVMVALLVQKEWADLCRALEIDHVLDEPRYAFPPGDEASAELAQLIAGVFETRTSGEWVQRLLEHDVPSGRVNSIEQAAREPHAIETGMSFLMDDPHRGSYWLAGPPVRLRDNPPRAAMAPSPLLGQHTSEVLQELGYNQTQIQQLAENGVIITK